MSIREELERALGGVGLPLNYIKRGKSTKCIVYNYFTKDKTSSDNEVECEEYNILLNVYIDSDIEKTINAIKSELRKNKFYSILPKTTFEEEGSFFNTPIQCKKNIYLRKDDV